LKSIYLIGAPFCAVFGPKAFIYHYHLCIYHTNNGNGVLFTKTLPCFPYLYLVPWQVLNPDLLLLRRFQRRLHHVVMAIGYIIYRKITSVCSIVPTVFAQVPKSGRNGCRQAAAACQKWLPNFFGTFCLLH
jgi:hypothetical protein